ncbi:TonB-dependent receptor [Novosphingobium sp. PC22D]|uniref:TonB-dependent receptor n=1 Tax=Novosphingobium sp. PC22D TaxID=1962403 RepID=UPI000BF0C153|nr:TonB-dependent receptor [Novosphingobium sp. PC22D]PEQ10718.1 TonB-dependent receptor [Novosphingobium sp. PC22D]
MPEYCRLLRVALSAGCAAIPMAGHAQETTSIEAIDVASDRASENVARTPITGVRVDRQTLERRQARSSDIAELLADLPGVSAATGGGFSSMPSIRGLSEQRLTVLVDGFAIDAACPNDMNPPLSYTDPQSISSITVLTGVAPVSSGGDNIGGVISVESAPPKFAVMGRTLVTGEASSFYRSNGDAFGGAATLTVAGPGLSATYTGSYIRSDQYHGGGNDGLVRSSEYAKTDHALALAWQHAAGLLRLKGGIQSSPYEGFPNQYMDMVDNKSWFVNASYEGYFDWGDLELKAAYRDTDHAMNFLEDKLPGAMPMNTEVHSLDASAKVSLPVSMHDTVRIGSEYHHQWLDDRWPPVPGNTMMGPNAFVNINGATRDRIGAFAEWERHWSDRASSVVGIRYDRVEMDTGTVQPYGTGMMQMADVMAASAFNAAGRKRTDNNWSGSALFVYEVSARAALEFGYAHKVRSPNIYERYSWGRGSMASRMIGWYGDGNGYVGDPDLAPEKADTLSAALALGGEGSAWTLRIAPYYTRVDDYIDAAFLQDLTDMAGMPTGFVQLRFANQDAEFYGIDLSGTVQLAKGENGDGTRLSGSMSWLESHNLTDGGPVYRQMPLAVKIGVAHRRDALELSADFEWVARKTRVDATRNEPMTAAYALLDLGAAYTVSGIRVSLDVENVFDTAYDLPLGGVSLGDYKATGVLRSVPGRGRSFNLGFSTRF